MVDIQKAGMWKRASAYLFDLIVGAVFAAGFAAIISFFTGYDGHSDRYEAKLEEYQTKYNVEFQLTQERYEAMTSEEMDHYMEAYNDFISDKEAIYEYNMVVNLMLIIVTFGIFLGMAVMEFAVPMFLKNGQTLGKKIFGVAVCRIDGVKMNTMALVIRTLIGKYTIETMVPALIIMMIFLNTIGIVGPVIIAAIIVLEIILVITTRTNSAIHDLLANTVVVDMASQLIFDTEDEMVKYKAKLAAKKASVSVY
ncbi:MAG: RDD family protein [Lachnospiraceae bacterium]|nr:RDD family protein [Lachnospiraceae bacterium]